MSGPGDRRRRSRGIEALIIERNKPAMTALAEALLDQESLAAEEIKVLLARADAKL